jgi:hypothetical protein
MTFSMSQEKYPNRSSMLWRVNAANLACTLARVSISVVKFLILVAKFQ